ncbi:unnamed protein product [Mesocestoides corti]|uniref:Uncharacterized protein n=1 Tax=Mesocestoides corti TaxID=53468 RepID=A0A0R3UDF5_MESCO|nr:unnamed protein product [Mesocestoides corti]
MLESLKVENENLRARDVGKVTEILTLRMDGDDGNDTGSNSDVNSIDNGASGIKAKTSTEEINTTLDVSNRSESGRTSSNSHIVNVSGFERRNRQVLNRVTFAVS